MDDLMPRDDLTTLLGSILEQLKETRDDVRDLNRKQDEQSKELGKVLIQTQKTNGRVNRHDEQIKALESSKGKKLNVPTNVLYLLAFGGVVALLIVARLLGVDLGGVI